MRLKVDIIPVIIMTVVAIYFNEGSEIYTSEYFDYLDNTGLGEVDLFNASKSPEYSETSKAKISQYLNLRKANWSIKHPELWSTEL